MSRSDRRVVGWLVVCLALSYAWFFQGGGYNPNARVATLRALADTGGFAIDAYPHTGDYAEFGGRRIANKAPALAVLGAPLWWAMAPHGEGEALSGSAWWVNLFVNAMPAAALGGLLFAWLARIGVGDPRVRAGTVLAYGLGTLAFPYATALYAHQPAAVCALAATAPWLRGAPSRAGALASGALAGLAVTLELSTAIVVVVLLAAVAADAARRPRLLAFVVGGLPFAFALFAYNAVHFGSPFDFWFMHANPEVEVRLDERLFGLPSAATLLELLVFPYRGLLPTSPVLVLAILGWPALLRANPWAGRVSLAVVVGMLLLVSSFHAWYGGWAPGARYLVPALPFIALPLAFGIARAPRAGIALGASSFLCMLAFTLTAVEVPATFANPLLDFALPHLSEGRLAVNPQTLDALLPPADYGAGALAANDASFHLGERWFGRGFTGLLPLVVLWGATLYAVWGRRRDRRDEAV